MIKKQAKQARKIKTMEWYQYLIIRTIELFFLCGSLWTLNMLFHILEEFEK